ncbi:MAG TPA: YoaK family protein [Solirubrobacterales bacterium]|nr:YoaK family protein [Solirubrobacterales bacterium]
MADKTSARHPLNRALLALTFTTGLVDAASYLGLGHVFTANMTGNIVLLGFGIAGSGGLPVLAPLVSLGAFLVGAGAGGVLAAKRTNGDPGRLARALAIEVSAIGVAVVVALAIDVQPNRVSGDLVIALLALAMGVRNATVRRIGAADLTTTVLTMTLTGLAAESPVAGGRGEGSARRIMAVVAMLSGAVAGALLLKASLALPLAAAAGLALLTWLVYVPAARRLLSPRSQPSRRQR